MKAVCVCLIDGGDMLSENNDKEYVDYIYLTTTSYMEDLKNWFLVMVNMFEATLDHTITNFQYKRKSLALVKSIDELIISCRMITKFPISIEKTISEDGNKMISLLQEIKIQYLQKEEVPEIVKDIRLKNEELEDVINYILGTFDFAKCKRKLH